MSVQVLNVISFVFVEAFLPEDASVTSAASQAAGSAGFLISSGLQQLSQSCVGQEHLYQLGCNYSQRVTAQST